MKIDRRRPSHWLWLVLFAANVGVAWCLRRWWRRGVRPSVVLYGHKLGGNLLALYERLRAGVGEEAVDVVFLTLDPAYHRALRARGDATCLATSPATIALLARADAVVSDHGLHAMSPLPGRCDLRFFDVWHGIPFKGFDADDFRVQHRYDEAWVASPLLARIYVERFGFRADRVHATGYARTDRLVSRDAAPAGLRRALGLDGATRCVLFAPTWKQDAQQRSLFPFGLEEDDFVRRLGATCAAAGARLLVRKHLNTGAAAIAPPAHVLYVPYADVPDTEGLLLLADALICDWSSIAFDYLLLDRPTLFLDVEAPFAKGFSLGPEYRFGPVLASMTALQAQLAHLLADPDAWRREHGARADAVRAEVYGDRDDGNSTQRCVARLRAALMR